MPNKDAFTVNDITPQKALELTQKGFDWLRYVQDRLNAQVPLEANKGNRTCSIVFDCKNEISLAECSEKVTDALEQLGWSVCDTSTNTSDKHSILVEVRW